MPHADAVVVIFITRTNCTHLVAPHTLPQNNPANGSGVCRVTIPRDSLISLGPDVSVPQYAHKRAGGTCCTINHRSTSHALKFPPTNEQIIFKSIALSNRSTAQSNRLFLIYDFHDSVEMTSLGFLQMFLLSSVPSGF